MWMMTCNLRASRGFCNGEPDGDWDEARARNDDEGSSRMRDLYWSEEKRVTRSQNGALNGRASISPQNGGRTKSSTVKRRKKEANVVTADQSFCNGEPDGDWDEARVRNDDEGSSRMRDLYWSEEKRVTRSQNGALNARASISPQNRSRTKSCTVKRQKKEANVVTADQSLSHSNEKLDKIEELRSKDEGEKVEKLRLTSEWEEPKSDVDDQSYSSV
nr:putative PHD zinc finger protein [Ipomoea batatas]